ncbi:leucyl aminopeptidase family protein [Aquisediminimonas sediminicola]|uniref:leucyl aminopeptidase family protein n=1 Tax=Alteraquisediminimonas sediminicola TaxID=2676787 RepID=UPI001C8E09AB|nr:leucyl aminopeptidase family protein [Aquisediminimonas sediminicola]
MTDFISRLPSLIQPDRGQPATRLHIIDKAGFDLWLAGASDVQRSLARAVDFKGKDGQMLILPGDQPDQIAVVLGVEDAAKLGCWSLAKPVSALPEGVYRLAEGIAINDAMLGWLLGQYRFDRYRKPGDPPKERVLLTPEPAKIEAQLGLARAVAKVRDLVNTPAADMGPAMLEKAAETLASAFGASLTVTRGDVLTQEYPMVAAVGRAAAAVHAPRMIELSWGDPAHPVVAIIGKGVCFDSGGLDIKPSSAMRLMKKDMGGAAHALALAELIMANRLPVRLILLVPAVENAVSGNAMRPGDVLTSRKGLTVEIGNTDAEGRLVLADALTRAGELSARLVIDFATLTGAARVALGPDLPAMFANDDTLAGQLAAAALESDDPIWRLPLHKPYMTMIKSDIADINNAGEGGMAGAITAALFLEKFVGEGALWAHLDTFAWRSTAKPGRPKGGDALGLRAVWRMLQGQFGANAV